MKKVESKIPLTIINPESFIGDLEKKFEAHKIKYKIYADIFELKNNDFRHEIWYNKGSDSKIKSELRKDHKKIGIANLVILFLMVIFLVLNKQLDWGVDSIYVLFIFLFLIACWKWIFYRMYPEYQAQLEEEHQKLLLYLQENNK